MKKFVVSLLTFLPPLSAMGAEGGLYRTTFNMVSGRPLMPTTITVEEVERTATSSVIEVSTATGDAKLAPEAAMYGLCGLARHRGERYIQARPISQSPLTLEVTFPKVGAESATPPTSAMAPNVFPVSNCPSNS
jgi:hypothetical protein